MTRLAGEATISVEIRKIYFPADLVPSSDVRQQHIGCTLMTLAGTDKKRTEIQIPRKCHYLVQPVVVAIYAVVATVFVLGLITRFKDMVNKSSLFWHYKGGGKNTRKPWLDSFFSTTKYDNRMFRNK